MIGNLSSAPGPEPLSLSPYKAPVRERPLPSDVPPPEEADVRVLKDPVKPVEAAEEAEKPEEGDKEGLEKMVERLNRVAKELGHRLAFDVYEGTEEFYAKVIDRRTNDVVKMVPAKEVLELHRKLHDVMGVILDQEV